MALPSASQLHGQSPTAQVAGQLQQERGEDGQLKFEKETAQPETPAEGEQ